MSRGKIRFWQESLIARSQILFILLVTVPLAVTGYTAYASGYRSIVKNVKAHLESVAILKQQEIGNWVKHLEHAVTWLASSPQMASNAATLAAHVVSDPEYTVARHALDDELVRIAGLGHVSPVLFLDGDSGQIVASSNAHWEGQSREAEPWFVHGKTRTYVSGVFYSSNLGRQTMVIAVPVRDSGGQLLGVLAAHANLKDLGEIMEERSGLGETGETYLVNEANLLLTASRFEPDAALKKEILTEGANRALAGESGVGLYADYRGVPVIGAYRWLEGGHIALLAEVDQSEAFAPGAALRRSIFGIGVGAALVVAVLGMFFARTITGPLQQLVVGVREVGRGNLDYRIKIKAKGELGQLADAFNDMAGKRRRAEEALQESREWLATTLRSIGDAVIATDDQGLVTFINRMATDLTGWCEVEAVGERLEHVFHIVNEQTGERAESPVPKVLQEGTVVGLANGTLLIAKDGTRRPIADSGAPLKDESGEIVGTVLVFRDITERREMQEQLVRAERLAVLGELAGSVGHELRNPLGAISNAAYFLNMVLEEPEPAVKETLEIVQREVARSERIIGSLLGFARPMLPVRRKVAVDDVIQSVLSRIEVPGDVELIHRLDGGSPSILADPDQIDQVLSNLVLNGIQAMPEGGRLTVGARAEDEWVVISVADTGTGIASENLGRIFEPLYSTKAKGIGLGLAVVDRLVKGHGGSISVESEVGAGTTFEVRLPVTSTEAGSGG